MSHYSESVPTLPRKNDWRDQGACRGHDDPDLWYAADSDRVAVRDAVHICHQCPVIQACARAAFRQKETFGIWGGMTAKQRTAAVRRIRARRAEKTKAAA